MAKSHDDTTLSRRRFLGAATLVGAAGVTGGLLAGCDEGGGASPSCPDTQEPDATPGADTVPGVDTEPGADTRDEPTWDDETDIVVVGGGGAGLVAAISAAEVGAAVFLLEAGSSVGGATGMSGGILQAAGTDTQATNGITDDTPDKHYEYWMAAAEGWADPDLVRVLADRAPIEVAWLAERGMTYAYVYAVGDIPFVDRALMPARLHIPTGAGESWKQTKGGGIYVDHLMGMAEGLTVDIRTSTRVDALITDEAGSVVGVVAETDGETVRIRARRAVVIASGGFARSPEMAAEFSEQLAWEQDESLVVTPMTAVGDGIRMARRFGAGLAGMGGTLSYPLTSVGRAEPDGTIPGIWVNRYGQRFVNEAAHYGYVMREVHRQEGHIAWAIFDEHGAQAGAKGEDHTADTLEDLAAAIDVPPDALLRTVDKWNADVTGGDDGVFRKDSGLEPLDAPPFRAMPLAYATVDSVGGLRIDPDTRVLDVNGEVVPRLYAAGMVAGGFIGTFYPGSGTAITATLVFGRIAGDNAAAEAPR